MADKLREKLSFWLTVNVILSIGVVALGGYMKMAERTPKPADGAEARGAGSGSVTTHLEAPLIRPAGTFSRGEKGGCFRSTFGKFLLPAGRRGSVFVNTDARHTPFSPRGRRCPQGG